jgi:hypothetical protein
MVKKRVAILAPGHAEIGQEDRSQRKDERSTSARVGAELADAPACQLGYV